MMNLHQFLKEAVANGVDRLSLSIEDAESGGLYITLEPPAYGRTASFVTDEKNTLQLEAHTIWVKPAAQAAQGAADNGPQNLKKEDTMTPDPKDENAEGTEPAEKPAETQAAEAEAQGETPAAGEGQGDAEGASEK